MRIERVLRWHSRNYHDLAKFLAATDRDTSDVVRRNTAALLQVKTVAESREIDVATATSGYGVTTLIKGALEFTDLPVFTDWQIASGFAHARPWAHHGFLRREQIGTLEGGHAVFRLTAREEMTAYLPVQALHLLAELLRMRHRRAGLNMDPLPDRFPDAERAQNRRSRAMVQTERHLSRAMSPIQPQRFCFGVNRPRVVEANR